MSHRPKLHDLVEELKPIRAEWYKFGVFLKIEVSDLDVIDLDKHNVDTKLIALLNKWLQTTPKGTWKDIVGALKKIKRLDVANKVEEKYSNDKSPNTSRVHMNTQDYDHQQSTSELSVPECVGTSDTIEGITPSTNVTTGLVSTSDYKSTEHTTYDNRPISDAIPESSPFHIFKRHMSEMLDVISDTDRLANNLSIDDLISYSVKDNVMSTPSLSRYQRASKLLNEIERSLITFDEPKTLAKFCHVLKKQHNPILTKISAKMMKELGYE